MPNAIPAFGAHGLNFPVWSVHDFLEEMARRQTPLIVVDGKLRVLNYGLVPENLRQAIATHKAEILAAVATADEVP